VINRIDKSIHAHDAEFTYEETTYVESAAIKKQKEFQTQLKLERMRKNNEVKSGVAIKILGGNEFSYSDYMETVAEESEEP
jgi:hypothetical protein